MLEYASILGLGDRLVQEDSILCTARGMPPGGVAEAPGGVAEASEQGLAVGATAALFALADGLGGHGFGEAASALAVQSAVDAFADDPGNLDLCFELGQQRIMEEQAASGNPHGMKTTLVVLRVLDGRVRWGHIGDSRLYYFKKNKLIVRTLDHSVPQMLVATGEIKEREIRSHPDRNRLLRSMGVEWSSPRYQLGEELALVGDESFLLCSDGLWEWVDERQMAYALRRAKGPGDWLHRMDAYAAATAAKALRAGAAGAAGGGRRDNYSAIAVWAR
jgi:serine/threonine protein phosphatase PrpC